jgi:hypothetical protein
MPWLNYAVSVDKLDTKLKVAITDGMAGLVGELLDAKCSILTPTFVGLHMIST